MSDEMKNEIVEIENGTEVVEQSSVPAALITAAITKGADLEKLEKLLNLQIKWEENEAKKKYVVAMTAFKKNPPTINKDKNVAYKEVRYSHASLANVTEKINDALSNHGLSASWSTQQNGAITVTCKITHILGHSEETTLTAPSDNTGSKNAIQAIGSTISYLQRYTLLALSGLATHDQDDDGKTAEIEYISEKQLHAIRDLMIAKNADEEKFCKYFQIPFIEELPVQSYQKAINALNAKQ